MAIRRMFSLRIANSARFLKMPISSQALYFHLGLHADDDGVVEAFNVLNNTGCTEDDLRVLAAKGFIKVLNEDLVSYITDWRENNYIRADRKMDSIYKDLLVSLNPDVELLEKKERIDTKKKSMSDNGQAVDSPRTDNGQSMDGIGKDRIGKDRTGEDRVGKDKQAQAPYFEDPELNTAFCEYVKFRKKIKAPLTDYAIKMAIIKINNLAAGDTQKAIAIVNQSILRGWRGFFPLEENKKNTKADELNDFYAMAQAWAGGDNVQS